jgi:dimethylglycine dehydrogenase
MLFVYDELWRAGKSYGIANYGSFAMNVMRMEKMFKGAGELTNEVTLPEADVMRFVRLDKGDFLGKSQTEESAASTLPWICTYLRIEADGVVDGHGGEAVLQKGRVVGSTASVAFGHTVGCILAFAYLKPHAAKPGTALEVIIAGSTRQASVLGEAVYDPLNLLPRAE